MSTQPDTGQTRASSPETVSSASTMVLSIASSEPSHSTPLGSTTGLITSSGYAVRCRWMPRLTTTLAAVSLAAGLGNVFRLPRMVFLNGGGPFLVVYICICLIFGIPMVFLEIGLGQFCQEGATKIWRAVPLLKGVGYVKLLATLLVAVYYPIIMTISFFYTVWCGKGPIPFRECDFTFKTGNDFRAKTGEECLQQTFLSSYEGDLMWYGVSVAVLFLIWALFMGYMFRDKYSYRSMTTITLGPFVAILIVLLVDAVTRDPSATGLVTHFGNFEWNVLLDIKVWYCAVIQVFFSTQLGFGIITTCSGKIYSKNDVFWTSISYMFCNLLVGILIVFILYLWFGPKYETIVTENLGKNMPEMFLFTVLYDAAVHTLGNFSALPYFAVLCSGFITMAAVLYFIVGAITVELNKKWEWWQVALGVCAVGFLLGIPSMLPKDAEFIHMLDHYVIGRMVLAATVMEMIGLVWIYGTRNLYTDFEFLLGYALSPIWKVIWIITPVLLTIVEIWSIIVLPKNGTETKSDQVWVYATGWALYFLTWIIIISTAISQIYFQVDYNLLEKIKSSIKASRNWGPVDTISRHRWRQWIDTGRAGHRDFTLRRQGTKDYTSSVKRGTAPLSAYRTATAYSIGTFGVNRATDKGPFKIQPNSVLEEHVCWRGSKQNGSNAKS